MERIFLFSCHQSLSLSPWHISGSQNLQIDVFLLNILSSVFFPTDLGRQADMTYCSATAVSLSAIKFKYGVFQMFLK